MIFLTHIFKWPLLLHFQGAVNNFSGLDEIYRFMDEKF